MLVTIIKKYINNLNHVTSHCMYWYHSEMFTENEHSALNVNQLLSLSPPPHLCLSSSQPTQEQGTAGRRTMCECEGHLTKRGAIFGCDQQPPSFKHVWLMPYSKQWFASHSVVTPMTREKETFVYPSQLKGWYKIKTHTFSVDFRALWHGCVKTY